MAKLESKVSIKMELRPCLVRQNRLGGISEKIAALFHKWIDKEETTLKFNAFCSTKYINEVLKSFHEKQVIPNDVEIIKNKRTLGLVEYYDGTVAEVAPTRIEFIDKKSNEYCFD